jgi:hypothetical protein
MSFNFGLSDGLMVFAVLAAIAATVLAFIFLVPEKRRAKLNGFGKFIHDTLNFKYFIISKVLQAFYIFSTAFVIIGGFFMLFQTDFFGRWMGGYSLLAMLLGPIIIRVVYELLMLSLLLVQNVISINRKLRNQNDEDGKEADIFASPDLSGFKAKFRKQQTSNPNAGARFCFRCGAPLDPYGNCPNCDANRGPQNPMTPPSDNNLNG